MLKCYPAVSPDAGVTRQVLAEGPELMVVSFEFEVNAEGKLHQHHHVQSTYVQSGQFIFTVDDEELTVNPGDSFVIPSNAMHGCRCLKPGVLIDTFTPRRDDFL